MNRAQIPELAEVLDTYYEQGEILELAKLFEIYLPEPEVTALGIARRLIEHADFAKHSLMLEAVLYQAQIRNLKARSGATGWDNNIHYRISEKIEMLRTALEESGIPHELVVPQDRPFSAKSEVREFLEKASTPILAVDPYIGVGTLDCLRSVKHPVRILTGTHPQSIEEGFDAALTAFRGEGFKVEVRRHPALHDRHFVFNNRCWLIGSSLKDAGKKAFNVIEIVDARGEAIAALENKWQQGTPHL
jgi:hypothetical protein